MKLSAKCRTPRIFSPAFLVIEEHAHCMNMCTIEIFTHLWLVTIEGFGMYHINPLDGAVLCYVLKLKIFANSVCLKNYEKI